MSVKKLLKLNECPEGNPHVATSFSGSAYSEPQQQLPRCAWEHGIATDPSHRTLNFLLPWLFYVQKLSAKVVGFGVEGLGWQPFTNASPLATWLRDLARSSAGPVKGNGKTCSRL